MFLLTIFCCLTLGMPATTYILFPSVWSISSHYVPLAHKDFTGSHPSVRLLPHICCRGGEVLDGRVQLGHRIFLPESLFDPFRPCPDNAGVLLVKPKPK
jgi:hypothetical protein